MELLTILRLGIPEVMWPVRACVSKYPFTLARKFESDTLSFIFDLVVHVRKVFTVILQKSCDHENKWPLIFVYSDFCSGVRSIFFILFCILKLPPFAKCRVWIYGDLLCIVILGVSYLIEFNDCISYCKAILYSPLGLEGIVIMYIHQIVNHWNNLHFCQHSLRWVN